MFGFEPIWWKPNLEGKKLDRAIEKVKKIENSRLLADVARNAPNPGIRSAAVSMLTDSDELIQIAQNKQEDAAIRKLAFDRISDDYRLAKIAATAEDSDFRLAAAKKITDNDALAELLSNVKNKGLYRYSYDHGTSRERILVREFDETILKVIIDKLPDSNIGYHRERLFSILGKITSRYTPDAVRCCVERITDQNDLKRLLKDTRLGNARLIVYDKLSDPAFKEGIRPQIEKLRSAMDADEAALKACAEEQKVRSLKRKCINMMIDHFQDAIGLPRGHEYVDHIDPDIPCTSDKYDPFQRAFENYGAIIDGLSKEMIQLGYKNAPTEILKEYCYIVCDRYLYGFYLLKNLGYLQVPDMLKWLSENCIRIEFRNEI